LSGRSVLVDVAAGALPTAYLTPAFADTAPGADSRTYWVIVEKPVVDTAVPADVE
jgi:hypothetical protein